MEEKEDKIVELYHTYHRKLKKKKHPYAGASRAKEKSMWLRFPWDQDIPISVSIHGDEDLSGLTTLSSDLSG